MIKRFEKVFDRGGNGPSGSDFAQRTAKAWPGVNQARQWGQAPLRMIDRARAAQFPNFPGQNQALQLVAMRPPAVPEFADVILCRAFVDVEVWRFQKAGDAEEDCFSILEIIAQRIERDSLSDEHKRKFVLFITECRCNFLIKGFVRAVDAA